MKTKLYLLTTFILMSLVLQAQKYNVALVEEWTNNAWANSSRSTITYDVNGNALTTTSESWENGAWLNLGRMVNTLNDDGTVKETVSQSWQDGNWQDAMTTTFTYSATKKVLTQTTMMSLGEGMPPIVFGKLTNTYNDQDQLTTQLSQTSNFLTQELMNSEQNLYTYNTDGTENQMVSQTWALTNQWENKARNTNTYNVSKQVISDLNEAWANNTWVNDYRDDYTYSTAGQVQEATSQDWDGEAWVNSTKDLFTYNDQNEISQVISQEWNTTTSTWDNKTRITYSYDGTGFDPIKSNDPSLVVFPNPFTGLVTIQSKLSSNQGIEVFNAKGQLIYSIKTPDSKFDIDLGGLQKGVYFLKSTQNNQIIKLLKVQ